MIKCLKFYIGWIFVLFIYSCADSSIDLNWREKTDFINKNGDSVDVNSVEQAGLLVYEILAFILRQESKDTLETVESPLPWIKLEEQKLNLELLQKIKSEFTFDLRPAYPGEGPAYPTFFVGLGTFYKDENPYKYANLLWKMKNHTYSFKDEKNKNVEIDFFNQPLNIPLKKRSAYIHNGAEYQAEVTHYSEIQYIPKNKEAQIKTGNVSFDMYAKTGYTKLNIDEKSKGKIFSLENDKLKVVDFTKDFVVYELLSDDKPAFKTLILSEDSKRYKKKYNPKTNDWLLSKRTSGVIGVNKVVWDHIKSIDYKLEKEPFLAWFATEVMSKRTQFSQKELKEKYQVAFAIGDVESMILYKAKYEKKEEFNMVLK